MQIFGVMNRQNYEILGCQKNLIYAKAIMISERLRAEKEGFGNLMGPDITKISDFPHSLMYKP